MKKAIIIICITVILLILAITFIVPPVAKSYIENNSKELVHRKMTIGDLSLNIFKGAAKVKNFTMYEEDDTTSFVSFDNLKINLNLLKIITKKIEVEDVTLSGARVIVIQNGDTFNFDDIINFFSSDSTEVDTTEEPSDWHIIINNIQLDRSYVTYEDKAVGSEFALRDVSLFIPCIDLSDVKTDMGLELAFKNGGSLATKIKYDTDKSLYDLQIALKNFNLKPILPYLQQSLNVESINGIVTSDISIKGSTQHVLNFDVNGTVSVSNFSLVDSKDKQIVGFSEVSTNISKIDLINNEYVLNSLNIKDLQSYFEVYKNASDNFTELFKETENTDTTATDSTEKPMSLTIKDLQIANAHMDITIDTLPQKFTYNIDHISIAAKDFNPDKKNKVDIQALLHNTGKLRIKWIGSIDDISNQNINLTLSNLELTPFTPFSLALFGLPISSGHMSIQSNNSIINSQLDGANKINMYNPKFGEKDKSLNAEYGKLPLKLGIYVLTDKNNKVNLDLPVSGNIDSPDFSYRKLIFKTLGTFLVKVASSPFNAFKSNEENLDQIDISSPYSPLISDEEYEKFTRLGSLAQEKTELKLNISQEIYYPATIAEYCINELKKNVFLKTQGSFDETNDLLLAEKYSAINISSPEVTTYADSLMKVKGLSISKKMSNDQKAVALYETTMSQKLSQDANDRNAKLSIFLIKNCNLSDATFTITTNLRKDDEQNEEKSKKNFYKIEWQMKDGNE